MHEVGQRLNKRAVTSLWTAPRITRYRLRFFLINLEAPSSRITLVDGPCHENSYASPCLSFGYIFYFVPYMTFYSSSQHIFLHDTDEVFLSVCGS